MIVFGASHVGGRIKTENGIIQYEHSPLMPVDETNYNATLSIRNRRWETTRFISHRERNTTNSVRLWRTVPDQSCWFTGMCRLRDMNCWSSRVLQWDDEPRMSLFWQTWDFRPKLQTKITILSPARKNWDEVKIFASSNPAWCRSPSTKHSPFLVRWLLS